MENILQNLSNPDWWFTGLFFSLVAISLPKLIELLKSRTRSAFRGLRLKKLKGIKRQRHNELLIHYELDKISAYFLGMLIIASMFMVVFVASPLIQVLSKSPLLGVLLSTPVYVFEYLWLQQDSYVKELIASRTKFEKRR